MHKTKTDYILKKDFLVTSADVDFEGTLRVSSLVNFFIQSAWQHAELLGWGVNDLLKKNLAWVLSGLSIEILRYPQWKQNITVETWPKGVNRLFYMRDFYVYGENESLLARATTNWLLIDIEKRRPKLIEIDNVIFNLNKDRHAINGSVPNLDFNINESDDKTAFHVRYSNVDVNQHLTTTGYIDFVFDTYTPDFISRNRPQFVVANFIKEIKFGTDIVMLKKEKDKNRHVFQLQLNDTPAACFRSELIF